MSENTIGNKLEEIRELLDIEAPHREKEEVEYAWYVGATGNDENGVWTDFSDLYISEGRWENGWDERFIDEVKSMKVGDRIVIKSTSRQKNNLPFNNNGKHVGFADIKAIGTIVDNPGDGKNIQVSWTKLDPAKRWYSFCGFLRDTVNLVQSSEGYTKKALLRFTFSDEPQDYSLCEEKYVGEDSETVEDIFSGFEPWLRSYNNPDYTGKQKYNGYARALVKLVDFMKEQGIIDDSDLNDKNIDKYYSWLEIYNSSEDAKEFDEKKNSTKAGSAALGKYIMYIEYVNNGPIVEFDYNDTKGVGINKIFYGTPGCGKSYHIDHKILGKDKVAKEYKGEYEKDNIIRTTFYQDYSNTDFVGQILPKVVKGDEGEKDTVEYIFNPGPFTLALIQAISNPTQKVALVIEEINRGNAPAIFGDIFQLLDRDDDSISEYGIVNVSLMDYLNGYEFIVNGEKKRYSFADIKIPGNMDIFATMNTSDQNVYTLDTAFVRRWEKEKIKNSFDECDFKGEPVPGMSDYTWKEFVESINKWIARNIDSLQVNEDKQIGAFFVKKSLLTKNDPEKFAYKVFDYLWSDVAKLDHDIFFNSYNTLEDLIEAYKEKGVGVFKTGIFDAKATITDREEENDEQ